MATTTPLVSVIIPTYKRPLYLQRAIESAMAGMNYDEVEILVIPNGGDDSWKQAITRFNNKSCIKVHPSAPANPNIARNTGLKLAKGKLIRFLDDDDFLIPEIARKQYLELLSSEYDLSIYSAQAETADHTIYGISHAPLESDYGAMVLSEKFLALPFVTTYKRSALANVYWNEQLLIPEDEEWMRKILATREVRHITSKEVVGVWFQHELDRLSLPLPSNRYYMNKVTSILETCEALRASGRLSSDRAKAAAKGLWGAVHGGFYFSPIFWSKFAAYAKDLDPFSHPDDPLYSTLKFIPPLILEWLMLPKRWANHAWRHVLIRFSARSRIVRQAPG